MLEYLKAQHFYQHFSSSTPMTFQNIHDKTHILSYADDITLLLEHRNLMHLIPKINNTLNDIINWQEHWLLKTNLQKSSTTIFGKNRMHVKDFLLSVTTTTTYRILLIAKY